MTSLKNEPKFKIHNPNFASYVDIDTVKFPT